MFTAVALLIVMVHGVDSLLVLKNTMMHGTALAVFGLATLVSKSMLLFNIVKYAGAAYLVWLGIQSWRARAQNMELHNPEPIAETKDKNSSLNCMTQGITTDLLNPKTLLLYVTLMPQFIDPSSNINMQLILLAFILVILSVVCLQLSF